MTLRLAMVFGLLAAGSSAAAQEVVNSPDYHARHNASSAYYHGSRQQPAQPAQPTGYWEKTWGAIATSETGGALGTAVGISNKAEAEQVAMQDCRAKGGSGCRVDLTYRNQCAVMVVGKKQLGLSRAASIEEATADGLAECAAKGDSCRVYYSACTEPIFHKY